MKLDMELFLFFVIVVIFEENGYFFFIFFLERLLEFYWKIYFIK